MIVYNLHTLLAFIIILPICYALHFINPDFWGITQGEFWSIVLLITGLGEAIGLKSRVYYIPFWTIAWILFIMTSFSVGGTSSLFIALALGLVIMISSLFLAKGVALKRWTNATKALEKARSGEITEINTFFYFPDYVYPKEEMYGKLFAPIYQSQQKKWFMRTDVRKHYLTLIKLMEKHQLDEKTKSSLIHLSSLLNKKNQYGVEQFHFDKLKNFILEKGLPGGSL